MFRLAFRQLILVVGRSKFTTFIFLKVLIELCNNNGFNPNGLRGVELHPSVYQGVMFDPL